MRENAARNILEDTRLENLNAGEHQRRRAGCHISGWDPGEPGDEAVMSFDDAEPFAVSVLEQHQCRQRVSSLVLSQSSVQINIGNDLSVNYDERVVFQKVLRVIDRAAGAEDDRLMNVFQLDAELAAIAQRALN